MNIKKFVKNHVDTKKLAHIFGFIPDNVYLKIVYRLRIGKKLNLKEPKTFNEKIQWLKLYDRKPIYTTMVDKYEAKKYVADIIGDEYIIPTLGVWDHFDDIDFASLPEQFVLKCTHDSGGLVICYNKGKFDKDVARKKIEQSLKCNFYWVGREWPYKNVKPRIIAEKYMVDESVYVDETYTGKEASNPQTELMDYKLMCFNGKVKCSFVCSERYSSNLKVTFFDNDWNVLPFERHYPKSTKPITKPHTFEKMVQLAEKLSADIPFVRVDFYEINGDIYFGELTFYPGDGFEEFTPDSADYDMGRLLKLPDY
ncbi:MAG TPA: glycosyl transferase [Candidatus Blautia faecipullorum]|nr:glycosyl transferase [Candidatus Blautia faecipullorum]